MKEHSGLIIKLITKNNAVKPLFAACSESLLLKRKIEFDCSQEIAAPKRLARRSNASSHN